MALLGRYVENGAAIVSLAVACGQSMQQLPESIERCANGRALFSRFLGTGPLPPPEWWDSQFKGKITFPEWRLMREYWQSVCATELALAEASSVTA